MCLLTQIKLKSNKIKPALENTEEVYEQGETQEEQQINYLTINKTQTPNVRAIFLEKDRRGDMSDPDGVIRR